MAKCGIKKYDDLPSRVGWIDVDYLRARLSQLNDWKIFARLDPLLNYERKRTTCMLEEAHKKHEKTLDYQRYGALKLRL